MGLYEEMTALADAVRQVSGTDKKLGIGDMREKILEMTGLALTVMRCAYSGDLPDAPAGNTIAVVSEMDMTGWDLSQDEPFRRSGNRNLNVYPYCDSTKTHNGITFTDNGDGTITVNGTASAAAYFYCSNREITQNVLYLRAGTYTISDGSADAGCRAVLSCSYDGGATWATAKICTGETATVTLASDVLARLILEVRSNQTCSGLVLRPQIERGTSATEFVKGSAEGQVWIGTGGGKGCLNALVNNGILILPAFAKQFVAGKWVFREAWLYRNAWAQFSSRWDGYYFNAGEQYEQVTGGWTADGYYLPGYTPVTGSVGSTLKVATTEQYTTSVRGTVNPVDLTDVKKLYITVDSASSAGLLRFRVLSAKSLDSVAAEAEMNSAGEKVLDVSALKGKYYLAAVSIAPGDQYYISAAVSKVRGG